jgi:hypothetical protein
MSLKILLLTFCKHCVINIKQALQPGMGQDITIARSSSIIDRGTVVNAVSSGDSDSSSSNIKHRRKRASSTRRRSRSLQDTISTTAQLTTDTRITIDAVHSPQSAVAASAVTSEFPVVDTAVSDHLTSDDGNSTSLSNSDSAAAAIAQRSMKSGKAIGKNRVSNRRTSHSLVPTPTHCRYSDDDNSYGGTFDASTNKDILSDPETESEYLFASGLYGLKR